MLVRAACGCMVLYGEPKRHRFQVRLRAEPARFTWCRLWMQAAHASPRPGLAKVPLPGPARQRDFYRRLFSRPGHCRLIHKSGSFPVVVLSSFAGSKGNLGSYLFRFCFYDLFDLLGFFRLSERLAAGAAGAAGVGCSAPAAAAFSFFAGFLSDFFAASASFFLLRLRLWPLPLPVAKESSCGWSRRNSHRSSQSAKKHTDPDASVQRGLPDSLLNTLSPVPRLLFYPFAQRPLHLIPGDSSQELETKTKILNQLECSLQPDTGCILTNQLSCRRDDGAPGRITRDFRHPCSHPRLLWFHRRRKLFR